MAIKELRNLIIITFKEDVMGMIECPDCKKHISESSTACPNCGRPNTPKPESHSGEKKTVSIPLGLGIFFLPIIFSWFTLQKGYSTIAKLVSFGWLTLIIIGINNDPDIASGDHSGAANITSYPVNHSTYAQVNSEVGCDSKYSDDKKEDIFKSQYQNHWFTWRGVILLAEADDVSLNIDGVGTQDLQVDFANPNAGYDLVKDSTITVKFLMKSAGGCFLPFTGDKAELVK